MVAPFGDVLQAAGDALVPGGRVGQLSALELGLLHGGPGVAAQPGDALDRLPEHSLALAAEPDVPVVRRVAQRDGEADADAAHEVAPVAAGFLLPVVGDGVHHAEGVGARVEVEAHGERQQGVAALAVCAVDADDRADGAVLLDGGAGDRAVEPLGPDRGAVAVLDLGLAQHDEACVAGDLGGAAGDRPDEGVAAGADPGGDDTGGDGDGGAAPGDGDLLLGRGGGAGLQGEPAGSGTDGVGGPLEGAVGPVGERPGLDGDVVAVGVRHREGAALRVGAAGPGDADGGTGAAPSPPSSSQSRVTGSAPAGRWWQARRRRPVRRGSSRPGWRLRRRRPP